MPDLRLLETSDALRPVAAYWRAQLRTLDEDCTLAPRAQAGPAPDRRIVEVLLGPEASAAVDAVAADPLGRFTAAVAAVALLASRYFNTGAPVVRTPVLADAEPAALNTTGDVVLVLAPADAMSYRDWLRHVADVLEESYTNQDFPIAELLREDHGRDLVSLTDLSASSAALHAAPLDTPGALHLVCDDLDRGRLVVSFDASRLDPALVNGFVEVLPSAIAAIADRHAPIATLDPLPAGQREQLDGWNDTGLDRHFRSVPALFEAQAAHTPEATALVFGNDRWSYETLNRAANRVAFALRHGQPEDGRLVGIWMDRSPWMVAAVLGVLKAGLAYVPIEPESPPERLAHMVSDAGLTRVLVDEVRVDAVSALGLAPLVGDRALELPVEADANPGLEISESDLAYVIYTSGSTGLPKGCALEHGNLSHYVCWALDHYWGGSPDAGTMGLFSPLSFDFTVTSLFCPLLRGRPSILFPQSMTIEDVLRGQFDATSGIDAVKLTPSHVSVLETMVLGPSAVRLAILGGEELTPRQVDVLARAVPGIRIVNEYGPTEAAVGCIVSDIRPGDPIAIGRPISNMRAYVLDASQRPLPAGVRGEICVSGAGLARGYCGQPDLTATKFVPHPFRPGERLYRTGDIGRWRQDGVLECFGRTDSQVKLRGYRLELGEIEAALAACPGVREAVVLAVRRGTDQDLVAFVVGARALDARSLRPALTARLPAYMVPSSFVRLDTLPLTPNGKIDRARLAESGAATAAERVRTAEYIAPRNDTERTLAGLWQELLHVHPVGAEANFIELGGHSLRAMQLVARIHDAFGVEMSLRDVFSSSSLADLASRILEAAPAHRIEIAHLPDAPDYPVSHGQRRLWILDQIEDHSAAYNVSAAFLIDGEMDLSRLADAFAAVTMRHESLRTTFVDAGGEPRQQVHPTSGARLRVVDLSAEADADEHARVLAAREGLAPFDLATGPLVRATALCLGTRRTMLMLTLHHAITDEWSFRVLVEDLVELYARARRGLPDPLPVLAIQYRDYAAWQLTVLRGEQAAHDRAYWLQQLRGPLLPLDLPTDFPRPAMKTSRGGRHRFELPPSMTLRLRRLGVSRGASLFMTLVALVQTLLHRYTGQDDIRIGTPIAGRKLPALERQIGFFVNTLVLRGQVSRSDSFEAILERVAHAAAGAYDHDAYPFDLLVQDLDLPRDTSRSPVFDVMVTYGGAVPPAIRLPDLHVSPFEVSVDLAKFDLTFHFDESVDALDVELEYNADLFRPERMARLATDFLALAAGVLGEPATPIEAQAWFSAMAVAGHRTATLVAAPRPAVADTRSLSAAEATLADIWRDVLHVQDVGLHDSFFGLGGDSIVALQVVSRARQAGLHVSLRHLFRHPTIAALAAEAAAGAPGPAATTLAAPPGLTPIQHWFFEQDWADPSHFNQSILLEVPDTLDSDRLARAVSAVAAHHDALSTSFAEAGGVWSPRACGPDERVGLAVEPPGLDDLPQRCEALQQGFDLTRGPLLRIVLFRDADGRAARLLVIAHHLVMDGVSWSVLFEDLRSAYDQAPGHILLPPQTQTVSEWVSELTAWASSDAARMDLDYWLETSARGWQLPVEFPDGIDANLVSAEDAVTVRFDEQVTTALLTDVPHVYNTRINDALLAALALAVQAHTGETEIVIDLEGYGREPVSGNRDLDLSRSVGWFTSLHPLKLTVPRGSEPGAALKQVKETLRGVPARGLSYGALRYLSSDADVRERLAGLPAAPLQFNYLGRLDHALARSGWREASEFHGRAQSPAARRAHLLDVIAVIAEDRLEVTWVYGTRTHHRQTIERLAQAFVDALHAVVAHCTSPAAGGLTPSDVPAATIGQTGLDHLARQLGASGVARSTIEDVYDLTPLQEGLLYHALLQDASAAYHEQWVFGLSGDLDARAFIEAWETLAGRHPVLRTVFAWRDLERPVQVVLSARELPWTSLDWRALSAADQETSLSAWLEEDRQRGFDMERGPLQRCSLMRLSETEYRFCWSFHHILLDGWSTSLVVRDAIELYGQIVHGRRSAERHAPPFRLYLEWLRNRGRRSHDGYWRARLSDMTAPTPLPVYDAPPRQESGVTVRRTLPEAATTGLVLFARRYQITMSTLVRGAWAFVLAAHSGVRDVVFGVTMAGRPADIPDVDQMVGLFINTLPVRVRLDDRVSLIEWLQGLQADQADLEEAGASALVDVQRCSGVPRGLPLFDSVVVFENYPAQDTDGEASGQLRITDLRILARTNYALTLLAAPGAALELVLDADPRRYGGSAAAALLDEVVQILEGFPARADQRTGVSLPASGGPRVRAALSPDLVLALDVASARAALPLRSMVDALTRALHRRYASHEDVDMRAGDATLVRGDVRDDETLASLFVRLAARDPEAAAAAAGGPTDLSVVLVDEDHTLALDLCSETSRFDAPALQRAAAHFEVLARHALAAPDTPLANLPLLPDAERARLLHDFNDTVRDWGHDRTIVDLFEDHVRQHPDRIAVDVPSVGRDAGEPDGRWTYAELDRRASQLARHLRREHGVGPDVLVGVLAERSLEMVLALVAVLKAGGAYVPLDPEYPQERLDFMVADCQAPVVLTSERFRHLLPAGVGAVVALDGSAFDTEPETHMPSHARPQHLAYMIYTSGSTGRPKGALNTHRAIANRLQWMQTAYELGPDDHVLQKTPFSFDVSVWELFWPLMTGARLVMAMPGGHRDSQYLTALIAGAAITTLHFVPSMLHAFLDDPGVGRCGGLRRVICSGEALPAELVRRFYARLDVPLHNLYGPTEAAVDVTAWPCPRDLGTAIVPIGTPIANTQIYILDRAMQPMPIGVAGELFIGGANVGRGYLNRPDLTAERFVADPFADAPEARLYRTGDLARFMVDGNIEFLGRLDHQVKLRGFRIELGEIEAGLLAQDGVREAVVIVREDHPGLKRIVAYVVPRPSSDTSGTALTAGLRRTLPDYMVPSAFVLLPELPRLPNGKLDRHALPAPDDRRSGSHASGPATTSMDTAAPVHSASYVPPRDDIERRLTTLWEQLLGAAPIGVTDDYFELGGHSVLAVQLMSRVQSAFALHLPLATLFAHPTVERLATAIREGGAASTWDPLVAIAAGGSEAPVFLLPGAGGNVLSFYGLGHRLAANRPVYGLQAVGLDGVTPPLTEVEAIAARHLDAVLGVQPHGPYHLAGHSFGGRVAYEMAQQLRRRGHDVALLGIFDTAAPLFDPDETEAGWTDTDWLVKICREIEEFLGIRLDVTREHLAGHDRDAQLDVIVGRMQHAGWWPPGADRGPLAGYLQVYKANTLTRYRPADAGHRVPIVLFTTARQPNDALDTAPGLLALQQQPDWGWGALSAGPVRRFEVPGDHLSMLADPHVEVLAAALRTALAGAGTS